jgi:hypothetical protein
VQQQQQQQQQQRGGQLPPPPPQLQRQHSLAESKVCFCRALSITCCRCVLLSCVLFLSSASYWT